MKKLPTQEYLEECLTYNPESGKLFWKQRPRKHFKTTRAFNTWNSRFSNKLAMNSINRLGYYNGKLDGVDYLAHRVIWKLCYGTDPKEILHDKGRTGDNRIEKLSDGDKKLNGKDQKLRSTNSSGLMGVSLHSCGKWQVRGTVGPKEKYLGLFEDFFEACCARKSFEVEYGYHPNHGKR